MPLAQARSISLFIARALVAVVLATPAISRASMESVTLTNDLSLPAPRWMHGQGTPPSGNAPWALLAAAKRSEQNGDGDACLKKTEAAWAKAKLVQPWIAAQELRCGLLLKSSPASVDRLHKIVMKVEKNPAWLVAGPAADALRPLLFKSYLATLEQDIKTNRARAGSTLDRLDEVSPMSDDAGRARKWRYAGELAFQQQKLEIARESFRRSVREADSGESRARLASIESLLEGETPAAKAAQAAASTPAANASPAAAVPVESSKDELELVERVTASMKAGELISAVGDAVKLIRDFPGGQRAKWAYDRALDAYLSVADKSDPKFATTRTEMARLMEGADGDRVADWARTMYSRGQWEDALSLSRKALDSVTGARSTGILDLAAKAAMASDRFEVARRFFDRLTSQHSGTPASREALYRSGLLYYRQKSYGQAVSEFERLLAIPQVAQLELGARYWLWRSLQKSNAERASAVGDELMRKYPFSYYGLRVRMEKDGNALEWKPEPGKFSSKIWLTAHERRAWERAQFLLRAGWLDEAQAEIELWPSPSRAEDKAIRALIWAAIGKYSNAAKLANEAWDENPELRRPPLVQAAFPNEFQVNIEMQANARKLDKYLVRSLIKQESSYNPRAVSGANAMGLMQLIPPTAKELAQDLRLGPLAIPDDIFQPARNIQMGTYYLARLVTRYQGNIPLALASYNAGPTRIDRWLRSRPSLKNLPAMRSSAPDEEIWIDEIPYWETSVYVKSILRNVLIYKMLDQGRVQVADPIWAADAAIDKAN